MPKYEVLNKGHRVNDGTETGRMAQPGEIIDLPERAAAPLVPWRLKPRPDLDAPVAQAQVDAPPEETDVERAARAGAEHDLGGSVNATRGAMALAAEVGIDLSGVKGSAPGGRILKADVEALEASIEAVMSSGDAKQ